MAYSCGSNSPQTPLQQLLEDLHFLRAKDRRQHSQRGAASDDPTGGFAPTPTSQSNTHWTDLFIRHFLFQSDIPPAASRTASQQQLQQQLPGAAQRYGGSSCNIATTGLSGSMASINSGCGADDEADDLLFFVRKKPARGAGRRGAGATAPGGRFVAELSVCRKDSRKLPIGDPDVDWQETVYLNLIIHQFVYTLTLAICTRTSPKELQVLRRHSQRVYASPSRRQMDGKGEREEYTYPQVCFMVDNFDEVFGDMQARDGEMVCVELVASERGCAVGGVEAALLVQSVLFLGSIRYDGLRRVYETRQSASLSSRMVQRMRFGLFGAGDGPRCEFVRMNGPRGKGHAEMAVTKPKGSGVETPTSEPGYCATDMLWDDDDDDQQDVGEEDERAGWSESEEVETAEATRPYRRRLMSDPSASLQNFSRFSWRSGNRQQQQQHQKPAASSAVDFQSAKSRSQSEGLDALGNELGEIEAGDLTDELDDGAYNPLWTSRGCTQTFHFWKEHRRQQSTPLNAFCTYVSLPWWTIARDLLGSRERPMLTF